MRTIHLHLAILNIDMSQLDWLIVAKEILIGQTGYEGNLLVISQIPKLLKHARASALYTGPRHGND
ncbi:MAG: hypothetical protein WDN23_01485 [Edaphobacter sp.]